MKEELYKINFENYFAHKFKDRTDIDDSPSFENLINATEKHPCFTMEKSFSGEEHFKKHFANPLYSVIKQYMMVVVEKNGDKVSIKLFQGMKSRQEGKAWFKVVKNVNYISVNIKTGDVYHGYLRGYQRKKKVSKMVRRNCFYTDPLETLKCSIKNSLSQFIDNSYDETTLALSEFMFHIDQRNNFEKLNFSERLFRFYLNKKGIKYPNNFKVFASQLVGSEIKKILKKNQNKLIDAVMIKNQLFGKKVKHALHLCTAFNIELYKSALKLFGEDWLNQDDENIILNLLDSPKAMLGTHNYPRLFSEVISKEELKKVYILFKQVFVHQNLDSYTFHDHIRMYTELKMFGENDLKWQSFENKEDFRKEHLDWTDKIQHYKQGTYTRHYPEYMYEMISQPLFDDFHPILLDNSLTYNDESNHQSNCVKGYIGKPSCLIISVRSGEFLEERATIEYVLTKKDDKIFADRVQSLGKFNQKLESQWIPVLLKLDQVVLSCVRDERFETVKLTKKCSNGTILNSDSYFNDEGKLRWIVKNIDANQLIFDNRIYF
jgi:hypothetical protein